MSETREHKSGKTSGYETDGTNYWLAPTHVDSWGEIQDQERALDAIIEATVRSVGEVRRHTEMLRRRWWESMYADLGLDPAISYAFNRIEGKLSPVTEAREK